jgi:hypothetical protein
MEESMTERKPKPKRGNPSFPGDRPKSLAEIDDAKFRNLGLRPGRGVLSWGRWRPGEARRQGQGELDLSADPLIAAREENERNATAPRAARVPKRAGKRATP